ncbi:hypothetical protein [Soonwooa purpurea]
MNKNVEVILASAIGLFAVVGALAIRKVFKDKTYVKDYTDSHRLFSKKSENQLVEHGDGIEINAFI